MSIEYEAARQWLKRYQLQRGLIDSKEQRMESLKEKASSPGSPKLDGMPRAQRWNGDGLSSLIATYTDIERELPEDIKTGREIHKQIDSFIKRLKGQGSAEMRLVLQMKYLDLFGWTDIVEVLFLGKADFLEKEDSYTRRTFKIHQNGITRLSELMGEKELQEIIDFYGENFDFPDTESE